MINEGSGPASRGAPRQAALPSLRLSRARGRHGPQADEGTRHCRVRAPRMWRGEPRRRGPRPRELVSSPLGWRGMPSVAPARRGGLRPGLGGWDAQLHFITAPGRGPERGGRWRSRPLGRPGRQARGCGGDGLAPPPATRPLVPGTALWPPGAPHGAPVKLLPMSSTARRPRGQSNNVLTSLWKS